MSKKCVYTENAADRAPDMARTSQTVIILGGFIEGNISDGVRRSNYLPPYSSSLIASHGSSAFPLSTAFAPNTVSTT